MSLIGQRQTNQHAFLYWEFHERGSKQAVRLGDWKDRLMHDPTKLVDAYLDCAQGQGRWSGAADARRR